MAIRLEVLNAADGRYSISLEGKVYTVKTRWNTRTECWYQSIADSNGVTVTEYEKILSRQPLVLYNNELFAGGNLYAVNTTDDPTIALTRDNFGTGKIFQLTYYTAEEIASGG